MWNNLGPVNFLGFLLPRARIGPVPALDTRHRSIPGLPGTLSAALALFRLSEVHSPARSRPLHPRRVRVAVAVVADPGGEGGGAGAAGGEGTTSGESSPFSLPTRCTLNLFPRPQATSF